MELKNKFVLIDSPSRKAGDRSAKCVAGSLIPGLPAWAIKGAAFVLLITACVLDVTVHAADPTTQPLAKPATTEPVAQQRNDSRENRQSRFSRDRRGRDRGSSSVVVPAGDPFLVLNQRSIFVKGNQQITPGSSSGQSSQPAGALVRKPEASLVFNGVTVIDGQANAFIEDLTADHVSTVKVGDGIAGGKVSAITFDTLSYEAKGKVLNVALGQNLEGNLAVSTGTDSTAGAVAGPTTLPFQSGYIGVGAGNGVITNGMSPEDILARMKAKRQAELGAK